MNRYLTIFFTLKKKHQKVWVGGGAGADDNVIRDTK